VIAYIAIGNSDDNLSQQRWAGFISHVDHLWSTYGVHVHGRWFASPDVPWQSACWCIEFEPTTIVSPYSPTPGHTPQTRLGRLQVRLSELAREYHQDSIAWMSGVPEFIRPDVPEEDEQ